MAQQRCLSIDDVPIHLVLASSLRLENATDQARLQATIAHYRPKLVVLDPFVRLSRADENSALEVSAVLGFLRELQRSHRVAILVVHHARKSVSGNGAAAGMALRGSGDFWAWGDSNLYLGRKQEKLHLAIEHRSAAQPEPVMLELCSDRPGGPYLRLCDQMECQAPEGLSLSDRILDVLRAGEAPQRLEDLRARLRVRMQTLVDTLRDLECEKRAGRVAGGWQATTADDPTTTASGETAAGSAEEQPAKG
jgi:hypothetical protein